MSEKTVLVVDDSRSARLAMRKFLEGLGYRVETADSAQNAHTYLKRARPHVIFLDHLMPGVDGFDALRALKENSRTAEIPVVLLSSNNDDGFVRSARAQGAAAVLPKPPDAEQARALLHRLGATPAGGSRRPGAPQRAAAPAQTRAIERTLTADSDMRTADRESTARLDVIERRLSALERRCDERMRADSVQNESLRAAVERAVAALGEQLAGLRLDLEAAAHTQQQQLDELAEWLRRSLAEQATPAAEAALEHALAAVLQRLHETRSAS